MYSLLLCIFKLHEFDNIGHRRWSKRPCKYKKVGLKKLLQRSVLGSQRDRSRSQSKS